MFETLIEKLRCVILIVFKNTFILIIFTYHIFFINSFIFFKVNLKLIIFYFNILIIFPVRRSFNHFLWLEFLIGRILSRLWLACILGQVSLNSALFLQRLPLLLAHVVRTLIPFCINRCLFNLLIRPLLWYLDHWILYRLCLFLIILIGIPFCVNALTWFLKNRFEMTS